MYIFDSWIIFHELNIYIFNICLFIEKNQIDKFRN